MQGQGAVQRGLANEMRAAAWLIDEGFEVYMGVGSTSCDMVAMKNGEVLRVEVKTAAPTRSASSAVPWRVVYIKETRHDMLLVLLPDGTVLRDPGPEVVLRYGAPARVPHRPRRRS